MTTRWRTGPAALLMLVLAGCGAQAAPVTRSAAITAVQPSGRSSARPHPAAPTRPTGPVVHGASKPERPTPDPEPADWVCSGHPPVDAKGWLTGEVSLLDSTMRPAPADTPAADRARVLAAYGHSGSGLGGHPFAVFGLLSEYKIVDRPQWLVVVCDSDQLPPATASPMGWPGTAPSPGPAQFGVALTTFGATSLAEAGMEMTETQSPASSATEYVHVPWRLVGRPKPSDKLIRISYPAAEPCATFDHLAVHVGDASVDIRVWLRLLPGGPPSCPGRGRHLAMVGLNVDEAAVVPLGHRTLHDAGSFPPDELY